MSERVAAPSDVVEISKINGEFKRNYGTLLGAFLYLRSINAVRRRPFSLSGLGPLLCSGILAWLGRSC